MERELSVSVRLLDILDYFLMSISQGPVWEQYTSRNERLIELNGNDIKMIDDTFRKEQMDYINSIPAVFLH